jgi:cell wall-associated NlpC family hydrolase
LALRSTPRADHDLERLLARAQRQRAAHSTHQALLIQLARSFAAPAQLPGRVRQAPVRFWLHLIVIVLLPASYLLTQGIGAITPAPSQAPALLAPPQSFTEAVIPVGPVALGPEVLDPAEALPASAGALPVDAAAPDGAFAEIVALSEVQTLLSRSQKLAPMTVATTISAEQVKLRGGPGQEYDVVGQLAAGAPLTLEAFVGDWFAARLPDNTRVWVAAELVSEPQRAQAALQLATDIPAPPPPSVATVREENLSLRDGPGTGYVKLQGLPSGATIDLLARYEGWFAAQLPDGTQGWVTGDFLQIAPGVVERLDVLTTVPDPNPALAATAPAQINLRGGPSTEYAKLGTLKGGATVELIGRYKEWLKVRTPSGSTAWVSGEVLPVQPYIARRVPQVRQIPALPAPQRAAPAAPAAPARARAARPAPVPAAASGGLVSFALQFRGTPYAWGASAPGGFDCSGFTRYVYSQYGLNMPHSAAGQFSTSYGTFIDRGSLAAGDLVFFANTYKRGISHVGIYIGGGMVLQALAPGVPLSAVSMNGGYWQSKYYGALRPNL